MKMITFLGAGVACAAMGGVLLAPRNARADNGAPQAVQVFRASGASAADIQQTVDDYRAALGTLNPNVPGSFPDGRREINWDGVPDALAAPNNLPPDFFNATSPRGVVFFSPGNTFQVSANAGVGPIEFDNLNPGFSDLFTTFSPQRLFTALTDSAALNARTEILFFEPGSTRQATTSGFGVVFTDVDDKNAKVEFLDVSGTVIWSGFAPKANGDETLSFLGVKLDGNPVYMVRISLLRLAQDAIVMDDFIYGEPQPVF